MTQQALLPELPDDIYERVRRAAKGMNQPLETALLNIVKAATPSLEKVPKQYRAELEAMEDLSDSELWNVVNGRATLPHQRKLENLLEKNQRGELTEQDRQTLIGLRAAGDRLMLRRSYACLLLKYRGHPVPNLADLRQ